MLKQYKKTLILGSIVTVLPTPIQLLLGRDGIILWMPLLLLALHWLCVLVTAKDPRQEKQGRKPTLMVLWIMPCMSLFLSGLDFALSRNPRFPAYSLLCLLLGLMFLVMGNYMPKVRQNSTLGVKIIWTYTSEENWNATHRFTGRVWVIGGLAILLSALLPEMWGIWVMLIGLIPMILLPMIYSYRYYRMQKARGDVLTPMVPMFTPKYKKGSLIALVLLAVFVSFLMFSGDIEYRVEDTALQAEASFYDDLTIPYDTITELHYYEGEIPSVRTWGFASARLLMGLFHNEDLGTYTRYTYAGSDAYILITQGDSLTVLSAKTETETRALYEALAEKVK